MRALDYPYFAHPPLALAHRGGARCPGNVGIENSVAAFQAATALGVTHLETDVHATADGVLVAFHDDRLDRVTDSAGVIARLPWSQVRRARIGGREPIPTLAEILEALPQAYLNIDIKAAGAVEPLWRTIDALGAHGRVCVGSFSDRRLRAFRRLAGDRVPTSAAPAEVAAWRLAPAEVARRVAGAPVAFQVPVKHRVALPGGRAVTVRVVTGGFVDRVHAAGRQVHVWTIDDPEEMERLLDLGVDGIVSDRPDVLLEVLRRRDVAGSP